MRIDTSLARSDVENLLSTLLIPLQVQASSARGHAPGGFGEKCIHVVSSF